MEPSHRVASPWDHPASPPRSAAGAAGVAGPWQSSPRDRGQENRNPQERVRAGGGATLDLAIEGTDFAGAMARNRRNTVVLALVMLLLGSLIGYTTGWAAEIFTGAHPALQAYRHHLPPFGILVAATAVSSWGIKAAVAFLCVGTLALMVTVTLADKAVLSMSGAVTADPATYGQLHNLVEEMALAAGQPKPAVYVIETDGLNAFATGLRPDKAAVTVTTGLIARLNREELQAVIGHEMAHIGNGDVRYAVMVAVTAGMIAMVGAVMREIALNGRWGGNASSDDERAAVGLKVFVFVVWLAVALLAPLAAALVRMAISREREYLADATAAKLTRNPRALASALAKISGHATVPHTVGGATEHLYIISPLHAYAQMGAVGDTAAALFSTHPPTEARIRRLVSMKD